METGEKVLGPLQYHQDWVSCVVVCLKAERLSVFQIYGLAYSPNGHYLATASDDYRVAIWDVVSGERMLHVLTGHGGYLRCVNWSADSKKIVTAALDNLIRVFDVETGALVCEPLSGHKSAVTSIGFRLSSNGNEQDIVSGAL